MVCRSSAHLGAGRAAPTLRLGCRQLGAAAGGQRQFYAVRSLGYRRLAHAALIAPFGAGAAAAAFRVVHALATAAGLPLQARVALLGGCAALCCAREGRCAGGAAVRQPLGSWVGYVTCRAGRIAALVWGGDHLQTVNRVRGAAHGAAQRTIPATVSLDRWAQARPLAFLAPDARQLACPLLTHAPIGSLWGGCCAWQCLCAACGPRRRR